MYDVGNNQEFRERLTYIRIS